MPSVFAQRIKVELERLRILKERAGVPHFWPVLPEVGIFAKAKWRVSSILLEATKSRFRSVLEGHGF